MNNRLQSHVFWGKYSPLSTLTGAFLLIMASSRLAFAILYAGAVIWVYVLTALVFYAGKRFLPIEGKTVVLLFLSSLFCNVYLILMNLLNPLLTISTWFFMVLIPPSCLGSGIFELPEILDTREVLFRAWQESACFALLIIAISLIREPLGMGTLSFPGGVWGIVEIFGSGEDRGWFLPVKLLSTPAGGFLLLGLGITIFRYFRNQQSMEEDDQ